MSNECLVGVGEVSISCLEGVSLMSGRRLQGI